MSKRIEFKKDMDEYEVWCNGEFLGQIAEGFAWGRKRWLFYPSGETFYTGDCSIEIGNFVIKKEKGE